MTVSQIANLTTIPIGIVCLIVSLRAFQAYRLTRSDMLFVLGLAMATISVGTFIGTVGDTHPGGTAFNTDWVRAYVTCSGFLFVFLSSLVRTHDQMQKLIRWQVASIGLFVVIILLIPFYPPTKSPPIAIALIVGRLIIYSCIGIRYAILYTSKTTRFSLYMTIAFTILFIGYALNIPTTVAPSLAYLTIIAALVRIVAYLIMLTAYTTE
jgi:hypothetical protein